MLAAGRLRERITVRRYARTSNGKGGWNEAWNTVVSGLPAEVLGQSGREAMIANTLQGTATFKITTRYREDIKATDQILWNGLELNIIAPPVDPYGRRQELQIFADTSSPKDTA